MLSLDSLQNLISGLGGEKDKGAATTFVLRVVAPDELNAMHRGDWLARKVVDIIPNDMTREWRAWQAKGPQIEKIEAVEKSPLINLQVKANAALQMARLFGGAVIFIGVRGADPAEPLDPRSIGQGDLQYLHVLSRYEVTCGETIRDVTSEFFGQPSYYEVQGVGGAAVRVHPSRMVRFDGAPVLDRRSAIDTWGDSILQVVYDALRNAGSAQGHIAALIPEAKVDIIHVPGLSQHTKTEAGRQLLTARFSYANRLKSIMNTVLIDGNGQAGVQQAGEKWEQKQISFAELPELMQQYLAIAAAAADIPVTRLLGESPGGLNSTGESDLNNYYDNIAARQQVELAPALNRLDEVIIRSALGSRPKSIFYTWRPLYGLTEKEQAEVFKAKADAARALAGSTAGPLLPVDALSDALVNAFIEDGSLPGLEAAIEEYGRLSEQEEDPADVEAAMPTERKAQEAADAEPRTLYVSRKLLNGAEFLRWAKSQGFQTTVPADELHVTVAYSRTPVDWMKMGEDWRGQDGRLLVTPGGARLVEPLGDKGAIVLLFNSSELSWRHRDMREAGASWDYEDYQPHVTITYSGQGVNLDEVEPYRGKLLFGPEIFEEIDEGWAEKLKET